MQSERNYSGAERVCVNCGEKLVPQRVGEVELDLCLGCGGFFLDPQEIDVLQKQTGLNKKLSQELSICPACGDQQDRAYEQCPNCGIVRGTVHCPACQGSMRPIMHGEIEIDICDLCHGIWLDPGELEKINSVAHKKKFNQSEKNAQPEVCCNDCGHLFAHADEGYFSEDGLLCERCLRQHELESHQAWLESDRKARKRIFGFMRPRLGVFSLFQDLFDD